MAPFRIDFYQPITFPTSYKLYAKLKTKRSIIDDFFEILSRPGHFFQKSFRPALNIISLINLPYRNKLDPVESQKRSP